MYFTKCIVLTFCNSQSFIRSLLGSSEHYCGASVFLWSNLWLDVRSNNKRVATSDRGELRSGYVCWDNVIGAVFAGAHTAPRSERSRIILCKSARPPTSRFVQTDCFQSKFNWNISERRNLMKESNVVSLNVDEEYEKLRFMRGASLNTFPVVGGSGRPRLCAISSTSLSGTWHSSRSHPSEEFGSNDGVASPYLYLCDKVDSCLRNFPSRRCFLPLQTYLLLLPVSNYIPV